MLLLFSCGCSYTRKEGTRKMNLFDIIIIFGLVWLITGPLTGIIIYEAIEK